ncbi:hypothetical protein [uncultured Shewanella sp.]|uniref:hypothetical protein n=1 Tax=uncultured Shewanella sp. TaxID=173975 RepID=UPI0026314A86|nr:hypothetical protein [uncultured Shewanella sp.]
MNRAKWIDEHTIEFTITYQGPTPALPLGKIQEVHIFIDDIRDMGEDEHLDDMKI